MKRSFNISFIVSSMFAFIMWSCNENGASNTNAKTDTAAKNEHTAYQHSADSSMTGMPDMLRSAIAESTHNHSTDTTDWNTLPTNYIVIAKQDIIRPEHASLNYNAQANGYVAADVRRNRKISVRTAGRIERLYVKYNYQYVHQGEKILDLYSPELNTYIEEYLFIRQTNDSILLGKAKRKLQLLGLSNAQIGQLIKSGHASSTVSIYSPYEGYVLFSPSGGNNYAMQGVASAMSGMNTTTTASPADVPSLLDNNIREGMYLNKGQTIFWVNDFKQVLGVLAFNNADEKYIRKGQVIVMESELLPSQTLRSSIQLIEPVYEKGQRFTQVRAYLNNPNKLLKQNSLLTAKVFFDTQALQIPQSSVQYLGRIAIVWVKINSTKDGSNVFQSRSVKPGRRSGNMIEVLEGLNDGESIAKDAAYLTDSEAIIKY